MAPPIYDLHGMTIASELPIEAATTEQPAEYEFVVGEPSMAAGRPEGAITAVLEFAGFTYWLAVRDADWLLRFDEFADFSIAPGRITAHRHPGTDEAMLPLMLIGGVLSHVLSARGHLVLHASAVELDGGALAVVGPSGTGKSTTAALLCATGCPLVTDDMLVIDTERNRPIGFRGTTALRLRPGAAGLLNMFEGESWSETADGRTAVRTPVTRRRELGLCGVVALARSDYTQDIAVKRLMGTDAVLQLLQNPRTIGWLPGDRTRDHFERSSAVADAVPVLRAEIPEPAKMTLDLARELRATLEHALDTLR